MELLIKKLTEDAIVPFKANISDSGFDLFANEDMIVGPGETVIIKTGIAIQLPEGHEAQIRPRSGITAKTKLRVQLGTIDESYRGELGIIVDNIAQCFGISTHTSDLKEKCNFANTSYKIYKGDKIAQLIIAPVSHPIVKIVDELDETNRGVNGFGSTGV